MSSTAPATAPAPGLDPSIQAALEEADRCLAETAAVQQRADQLEAAADKVAQEFPQEAARAGLTVGRIAYNQSGSLATGLEAGAVAVGVAAVLGVASYLHGRWKQSRCEDLLRELLEQKQALAKEKRHWAAQMRPVLNSLLDRLSERLQREAGMIFPVEQYALGADSLQHGVTTLFRARLKTHSGLAAVDYLIAEMDAWSAGRQQSQAARPTGESSYIDTVKLVLAPGPDGRTGAARLLDCATNGRLGLMRADAIGHLRSMEKRGFSEAQPLRRSLSSLAASLARARIKSTLIPFGEEARRFRALDRAFLKGVGPVSSSARRLVAGAVVIAVSGGSAVVFGRAWNELLNVVADRNPCRELPAGWATGVLKNEFEPELRRRAASCAEARATEACQRISEWVAEGKPGDEPDGLAAESQSALLRRLHDPAAELLPSDLQVERHGFPCHGDGPGAVSWESFVKRAGRSPSAWAGATSFSADLELAPTDFSTETREALKIRSQALAASLARSRREPGVEQLARQVCRFAQLAEVADARCKRVLSQK